MRDFMIIFNSDLDNTLIYSYKHNIGYNKICVELYQNREVSFMTKVSYDLLKTISKKFLFVPTTTRTVEQYNRIDLGIEIEYALVCNGGVLLENGVENNEWYNKSLSIVSNCENELKKAEKILRTDNAINFEIRNIKDLFIFTKSSEPIESAKRLKKFIDLSIVDIFVNGYKVYAVPKKLNKGNAILRLKKRVKGKYTIASGDSEFDVPMINAADYGIIPDYKMKTKINNKHIFVGNSEFFSDCTLKFLNSFTIK